MTLFGRDTFTATDGTDLASHTPEVGGSWVENPAGSLSIVGGSVRSPTATNGGAAIGVTPPTADYFVSADLTLTGAGSGNLAGVSLRAGPNAVPAYIGFFSEDAHAFALAYNDASTYVELGRSSTPSFTGGTMRIKLGGVGTALTFYVDNVPIITASDSRITAAGHPAFFVDGGVAGHLTLDNWAADDGIAALTHVVTGRGVLVVAQPAYLQTAIAGRPPNISSGQAEPPNWYHVGMLSWGSVNGAMVAYPVTRDLDLVQLPAGVTRVWYEFAAGVTGTITELGAP